MSNCQCEDCVARRGPSPPEPVAYRAMTRHWSTVQDEGYVYGPWVQGLGERFEPLYTARSMPAAPVAHATAGSDEKKTGTGERQEGAPLLSDEQKRMFVLQAIADDPWLQDAIAEGVNAKLREKRAVIAAHQQPQTASKG